MLEIASATVSPCEQQPGRSGTHTLQPSSLGTVKNELVLHGARLLTLGFWIAGHFMFPGSVFNDGLKAPGIAWRSDEFLLQGDPQRFRTTGSECETKRTCSGRSAPRRHPCGSLSYMQAVVSFPHMFQGLFALRSMFLFSLVYALVSVLAAEHGLSPFTERVSVFWSLLRFEQCTFPDAGRRNVNRRRPNQIRKIAVRHDHARPGGKRLRQSLHLFGAFRFLAFDIRTLSQ